MQRLAMVEMSDDGRVVIPEVMRKKLGIVGKTRFAAVAGDNGFYFRRIEEASKKRLLNRFDNLSREVNQHFKEREITPNDAEEAVRWARGQE
ncbi:MAG: hypothetical protein J7M27_02330 [Candidatus Latescibacteria bacterium]|nr:hypothetical protein [Candidatus Latescibacterota bacterium]